MPGFPSSPVPSSPASACQLWLLLLLAWPLRRCFWERRALSPKPRSCSGVWGSPGRQPGCWEWAQPPKSPNPPSPRACVGAGRGQKPPQQPPAPHRQQLAPEIWDFTPSLCRSAGVVWLSTPPAHPGTTAPPAHRRRLGTRRYPGECRGRVHAGRSLPRAGFLLRSQKARFPQPQCAGIELVQPQNPPGNPSGTAAGRTCALGSLRGCPARWC